MADDTAVRLAKQPRIPSFIKGITQDEWTAMSEADRVEKILIAGGKKPPGQAPAATPEIMQTPKVFDSSVNTGGGATIPPNTSQASTPAPPPAPTTSGVPALRKPTALARTEKPDFLSWAKATAPPEMYPIAAADWAAANEGERVELMEIYYEEMGHSMNDMEASFPRIKIGSGGVIAWIMPDGTIKQSFKSVVIFNKKSRAYWKNPDITGALPDCSSDDGKVPKDGKGPDGANGACINCPKNMFGSALKGGGKACKEVIDVFLWEPGTTIPSLLKLPPTSMRPFQQYVTGCMNSKPMTVLASVLTEFGLEKKKGQGPEYAVVKPTVAEKLDFKSGLLEARRIRKVFEDQMSRRGITEEDLGMIREDAQRTTNHDTYQDEAPPRGDGDVPF